MTLDVASIRKEFPILEREIDGQPLVYLDSANTSQKPRAVIDAMSRFMETSYAPINRSAYRLAAEATDAYEGARTAAQRFINAPHAHEVIFTKNATESLNLVAYSWGRANLQRGDVVVLTHMEHHANIVPWHMLVAERGIELRWVPLTADFQLDLTTLPQLLDGAKLFSFTAMSNVLGTITPVAELCRAAHAAGALAMVDGCQYVPHNVTDVQAWDADFMTFSSHKMCGPSGLGVLWGREALLDAMPPFLGGGNMIADVRLDGFTTAELPAKFEAGTPAIVEAIGFGAAIEFLTSIGMHEIRQHEMEIAAYTMRTLTERFGDDITFHGPTNVEQRGSTFSFAFRGIHPHDLSQVLD
ncbi:MAG: aminotransferase class V-fold PLP-dependent enzyme, partial [Ilumatobacteraceae bacterium]